MSSEDKCSQEACAQDVGRRPAHRRRPGLVRGITCACVFVVVAIGLAVPTGWGTLSSFGWNEIAWICPLGSLEALLGAGAFVPRLLVVLAVVAVAVFFVGKSFCSFVCPVPHVKNLLMGKRRRQLEASERKRAADAALERYEAKIEPPRRAANLDSRHAVLASALVSAAVFGFPVFCLVCPVGLTIGTFIALWQLVQSNTLTWGLVVFPAIVVLEVTVLRRWCGSFCPMGALFSLLSQKSRFLRPTVDHALCLRESKGVSCSVCAGVCQEHVDPHSDLGDRPMTECVKCGKCVASCPVQAIAFKLLPGKDKR